MKVMDLFKNATPANFNNINSVVVLAPHPDDESLGCGGIIAMLAGEHKRVSVIFITDGSFSHPNSKKYTPEKLAALRKTEAIAALRELYVDENSVYFLCKKDRTLPTSFKKGFIKNTNELEQILSDCKPDLVLVPYEKDPHPDHRATWQMLMHIKKNTNFLIYEYLIWLYTLGEEKDLPESNAEWLYADISLYVEQKQKAIYKHVSQTTHLIDDDPEGFILTPDVLQHFSQTKEYFLNRKL